MKIVQLITKMDTLGGAQIHVRDLAIGMRERGHSVVLVYGKGENIYQTLSDEGIPCYQSKHLIREVNFFSDVQAFLELRKIIKDINPDLLATHSSKAGIIGRLVGWSLRIPTVFTAHGWSFTEGIPNKKRFFYRSIEKVASIFSSGIITVSEYDYKLARRHKIVPPNKLLTIHNGVHDCNEPQQIHRFNKDPIIMMVARFAAPKKQLDLVKALQKTGLSNWRLQFVGDGPLLKEAEEYVLQHELSHQVEFLGSRQDVAELLQQADLFVLLSDWEGLPLSILEAMRNGLPILASDVGGVREAVEYASNGYLLPKDDEEELIRKLTVLVRNTTLRLEMGKQSRRLFEEKFTFLTMLNKTNHYYDKLVSPRGGQRNESVN